MGKSIQTGIAATAICLALTGCHEYDFTPISDGEAAYQNYENAFIEKFGEPAPDQTWGFGSDASGITRSATAPEVLDINAPYDEAWVAEYLTTAKEPNSTNILDNYDNTTKTWIEGTQAIPGTPATLSFTGLGQNLQYNLSNFDYEWFNAEGNGYSTKENTEFWKEWCQPYLDGNYSKYGVSTQEEAVPLVKAKLDETNRSDWYSYTPGTEGTPATEGHWEEYIDETFVLNFKITGTWNGNISVLATEGLTDNVANGNERTVVVTGKWQLEAQEQRVGAKGRIIVAKGGEINIPARCNLNSVNEAQIVVLPGGKITGEGAIAFNNGTANDLQSYNGGTIDVAKFNNNGGNFYNHGILKAKVMDGGAGNSHYYNHNIISIQETGSSANLRIYNNCQFYCSGSMRARNYEGVQGSSLICGGELMLSGSEDGTGEESYVGLAAGTLVQCGTLYNNGTKWYGPTTGGYAVLDITDRITFINNQAGDFANNIYVCAGTWDNTLSEGSYGGKKAKEAIEAVKTNAVTIVKKSTDDNDEIIPASEGFVAGEKGCTPGFKGKVPTEPTPIRIIAEDLPASVGDFDFNDVVFDVQLNWPTDGKHTITLQAAGGTLPLYIGDTEHEVHKLFGVETGKMVNTEDWTAHKDPVTFVIEGNYTNANQIEVRVKKGSDLPLLTAETGKVPSKLAVPVTYKWCKELKDIETVYTKLKDYVADPTVIWYEPTPTENVYNK